MAKGSFPFNKKSTGSKGSKPNPFAKGKPSFEKAAQGDGPPPFMRKGGKVRGK